MGYFWECIEILNQKHLMIYKWIKSELFAILNEDECISYHKNLSNVLLQTTWDQKTKNV